MTDIFDEYAVVPQTAAFEQVDCTLLERFRDFHAQYPAVFGEFIYYANELKTAGAVRGSAWLIINRVRWESAITNGGDEPFLINNDFIALYARLAIHYFPSLFAEFCELRVMKAVRRRSAEELRRTQ